MSKAIKVKRQKLKKDKSQNVRSQMQKVKNDKSEAPIVK